MSSYNKIIIMGNLTRDPELQYTQSQTAAVEFGVATTHKYTSNGQQHEETCFIDCRMFGKRAEVIQKYFSKGKPIMIEGRLKLDAWNAQDGTRRSKHRIMVENFTFVGGGNNQGGQQQAQDSSFDNMADDDCPF